MMCSIFYQGVGYGYAVDLAHNINKFSNVAAKKIHLVNERWGWQMQRNGRFSVLVTNKAEIEKKWTVLKKVLSNFI